MRQLLLGRIRRGAPHTLRSGVLLLSLALLAVGCASHTLMPKEQAVAIDSRDRSLVSPRRRHSAPSAVRDLGAGVSRRQGGRWSSSWRQSADSWARTPRRHGAGQAVSGRGGPLRVSSRRPQAPETVTQTSCNSSSVPRSLGLSRLSSASATAHRATPWHRTARARRIDRGDEAGVGRVPGRGEGRPAKGVELAGRGAGFGTQVHAADGPARPAQSRAERRERQRHTEGGDGQPGAGCQFGKARRHDAPALGKPCRPAQGAGGPARCHSGLGH